MDLSRINFFPLEKNNKNYIFFYLPALLLLCWIFFSITSIFIIDFKHFFNGFVLFSIFIRLAISAAGLYFYNEIFIKLNNNQKFYNLFKAFVGYGTVLTFVFYNLPRMVGEFEQTISFNFSVINYLIVLFISAFPAILYLFSRSDDTRLILKINTEKELEYEKKVKKDKFLKKKEHIKVKSERSFLENLWYEWIDVIVQAIIIVLIIEQFFFQMYAIPSESMVPTFIKKDHVFVNKLIFGPHIPLTDWKFPSFIKPKVGDIVVFINPEVDDPSSDIKYKNVFTRIFHPFIFMATLSMVDIDKKADGSPKERFIVKRCIAEEGEKVCIVNDKVYKKTAYSDWKLMSDFKNQKEYGYPDLYYSDNPHMDTQNMTPYIRGILNESEKLIEKDTLDEIEKNLVISKNNFINNLRKLDIINISRIINKTVNNNSILTINNQKMLESSIWINFNFNNKDFILSQFGKDHFSSEEISNYEIELQNSLNRYKFNIYIDSLLKLKDFLEQSNNDLNYFIKEINTAIIQKNDESPYTKYMKRVNAEYKLNLLNLFNELLNNNYLELNSSNDYFKNKSGNLYNAFLLSCYLNGLERINFNIFTLRNFPDFPMGRNNYINKNEFFMLGDNRYNSLDSRLGYITKEELLDPDDTTSFSKSVRVNWVPHTIKEKYILGKAEFIYWPADRIRILK